MLSKILSFSLPLLAYSEEGYATFFSEPGYQGKQMTLNVGQSEDLQGKYWDDQIASFKLSAGVKMTLCVYSGCEQAAGGGASAVFGPVDSPTMPDLEYQVSHIIMDEYAGGAVTLYSD